MHLRDPERVLDEVNKYLKPGGVIACEEPHAGSLTTTPRNEHIERFNELFIQLGKLQGFDFNIGDKLYSILNRLDIHNCMQSLFNQSSQWPRR